MSVTAHAILLIVLPMMALTFIAVLKRRKPTTRQALIAAILSLIAMKAAQLGNIHLCREGVPRNQWLIIGPFLMVVLLLVKNTGLRRITATLLFLGMVGLSRHFTDVVHDSGWTGNPSFEGYAQAELRLLKDEFKYYAKEHPSTVFLYPAGWVRELALPKDLQETVDTLQPMRRVAEGVWHSKLTGLYRKSHVCQDYWYTGGRLDKECSQIELRDLRDLAIPDTR